MPLSQNSIHVLKNTVQWQKRKNICSAFVLFVILLLMQGQFPRGESIALYKKDTNQTGNTRNRNFCCGFCFFGNLHATWNKACPFAFSTKSEYKRRFFVVPAHVLQGKVFCTVVFLCLI